MSISVQPWGASTLAPQLSLAPGIGVALGDSVEVGPGRGLAVAPARQAAAGAPTLSAREVAGPESAPPRAEVDVAPAEVVASVGGGGVADGPPSSPAGGAAPTPTPAPAPAAPEAVPVAAPAPAPASAPAPPVRLPGGSSGQQPGPIAGGVDPGEEGPGDSVEILPGDEIEYAFSFVVDATAFGHPGEDRPILQIRSEASERVGFGLQLWDDGVGRRGLWASGDAMGGERFLAPLAEGISHQVTLYLQASSEDDGFYLVTLDGQPIDARGWVSLIEPGSSYARLEVGLLDAS